MIPSDVANSLRQILPDRQAATNPQTQPVAQAAKIADVLSNLVPGQRILAEIQALLPNGTYRAVVAQRDVTLALPFSAKPGDTLELEVAESDGKLTLAFVANRTDGATPKAPPESVSTSLSSAGKMIGDLLNQIGGDGRKAPPVPLNNTQPLVDSMPKAAADLAPVLKQAVTQSGMFYEAHQAEWVEGRYSKEQLLQEPQGKLAPQTPLPQLQQPSTIGDTSVISGSPADTAPVVAKTPEANTGAAQPSQAVAAQAQSHVQQQLEAFATQNFSWQGQVWPGQQMQWEIETDNERQQSSGDDDSQKWQTRLRLTLPRLGEVEARLHVQGQQLTLAMRATSAETRELLRGGTATLRSQLEQAGLDLASLGVASPQEKQTDVQFAE